MDLNLLFSRLSQAIARQAGRPSTFAAALALVIFWLLTGPLLGYSVTWQLLINTVSSIVTPRKVSGSFALTPKSRLPMSRVRLNAPANPIATPINAMAMPC